MPPEIRPCRAALTAFKQHMHGISCLRRLFRQTWRSGGFGNAVLLDRIYDKMTAIEPEWRRFRDRNLGKPTWRRILSALHRQAIPHDMISDDSGFWIIMKKE